MATLAPVKKKSFSSVFSALMGLGLGIFPNLVPFITIVVFVRSRLSIGPLDFLLFGSAIFLALPKVLSSDIAGAAALALQLLGAWLLYRAFRILGAEEGRKFLKPHQFAVGLLFGFAVLVMAPFTVGTAWIPDWMGLGAVWQSQSALYGHTVLTLGVLLATLLPKSLLRSVPLAGSAVAILLLGNAEALLAWLLFTLAVQLFDPLRSAKHRLLEGLLLVTVLLLPLFTSAGSQLTNSRLGPLQVNALDPKLLTDRMPYWERAIQVLPEHSLIGLPSASFSDFFSNGLRSDIQLAELPNHAHNVFLQTLFSGGVVGLLGLFALIFALSRRAVLTRDLPFLAAIAAVLLANSFDNSLFYAGVLYPVASAAGWRAATHRKPNGYALQRSRYAVTQFVLAGFLFAVASIGLVSSGVITALLKGGDWQRWLSDLGGLSFYILLLWPFTAWREGLFPGYGFTPAEELKKQVISSLLAGLLLIVGTFLLPHDSAVSRTLVVIMVIITTAIAPLGRILAKRLLDRFGYWGEPVVILGHGDNLARITKSLRRNRHEGMLPVATFELNSDDDILEASTFSRQHGIDRIIVATSSLPSESASKVVARLSKTFRRVQYVPDLAWLPSENVYATNLDGLLAIEARSGLAKSLNRAAKRVSDLLLITASAILVLPVFALLAVLIKLDSRGPVLFGHTRLGRDGQHFKTWKFRTMVPNAEQVLHEHLSSNPELAAEWEATQKLREDPRVTRIGKFLRATSLDELPQLINVVVGEMSLVGPRPIVDEEVQRYGNQFELYKMVRPGITGYWQVSGRSDTDYEQRVRLDTYYVKNWSVWMDIVILAKTIGVVLRREGAY